MKSGLPVFRPEAAAGKSSFMKSGLPVFRPEAAAGLREQGGECGCRFLVIWKLVYLSVLSKSKNK